MIIKKIIIASTLSLTIISNSFAGNKDLLTAIAVGSSGLAAVSGGAILENLAHGSVLEKEVRLKQAAYDIYRSSYVITKETIEERIRILENKIDSANLRGQNSKVASYEAEILYLKNIPTMTELEWKALVAQSQLDFESARKIDPTMKIASYRVARAVFVLSLVGLAAGITGLIAD